MYYGLNLLTETAFRISFQTRMLILIYIPEVIHCCLVVCKWNIHVQLFIP